MPFLSNVWCFKRTHGTMCLYSLHWWHLQGFQVRGSATKVSGFSLAWASQPRKIRCFGASARRRQNLPPDELAYHHITSTLTSALLDRLGWYILQNFHYRTMNDQNESLYLQVSTATKLAWERAARSPLFHLGEHRLRRLRRQIGDVAVTRCLCHRTASNGCMCSAQQTTRQSTVVV